MPCSPSTASVLPRSGDLLVRATLAGGCFVAMAALWGPSLVSALLPVFELAFLAIDDHYRIISLSVGTEGADTVVRMRVTLARPVFVNSEIILPDARGFADTSTAIGHVLLPVVLALTAVCAWPADGPKLVVKRVALCLALLTPLLAIDTPVALQASIWGLFVQAHGATAWSPLIAAEAFLQGGGRAAIAIAIAATVIAISRAAGGEPRPAGISMPHPGKLP